jgi:glycosyltransferase involved in cell wall biosynthesis
MASGHSVIARDFGSLGIVPLKILMFSNTDWYMFNFNRALAMELKTSGHDVLLVTPPGEYANRFEEIGLRWIEAPMNRRSLNVFRELQFLFWLFGLFRREEVNLVHSFTLKCCLYASLVAKFTRGLHAVNTIAGLGYVFTSQDLLARLLRPFVRALILFSFSGERSKIVLLNNDDFASFGRMGFSRRKTHLILGAGVSRKHFYPRDERRTWEPFRVVLPARMLWDKGIREFVEAARIVRQLRPDVIFLLAGAPDPGNPTAIDESQIRAWESDGLVRWLGHVQDMLELYHSVDAVVLPSYREGLPTSLTEAALCALPLIATDVPGCRDVIENEVDGLLVPVRNAQALALQINRLATDEKLRVRLGQAAYQKACCLFEEQVIIRETVSLYAWASPLGEV